MTAEPTASDSLPLMRALPSLRLPTGERLILASGSPRRAELLVATGCPHRVVTPDDAAEDAPRPGESAEAVVCRLAHQKASDVARRLIDSAVSPPGRFESSADSVVLAADTLGVCEDELLGKPTDVDDARRMLRLLRGRTHFVLTGICLWDLRRGRKILEAVRTDLEMLDIDDATLEDYLRGGRWRGKAGGFGYQDGNDWLRILDGGSESNVVGLPIERIADWIARWDSWPSSD